MIERVSRVIQIAIVGGDSNWSTMAAEVIAAMIQPTQAMRECGINAGWHFDADGNENMGAEAATNLWQAMIEKALEE